MKYETTGRLPIKMWLDDIDERTLDQVKNLSNLPFAYKWIALMPDAHVGYGMPIGGVLATKGVVIPNAVGVDIGCGMAALRLPLQDISLDHLKEILGKIRQRIPVGFKHHREAQNPEVMPGVSNAMMDLAGEVCYEEYNSALKQIGTLGGGNHFIEIQKGSDGHIWIMIHSGSRNLGFKVAKFYNNVAKALNKRWHTSVPLEHQLAFLPLDDREGARYLAEMEYCVKFAKCNRRLMMERVVECFREVILEEDNGKLCVIDFGIGSPYPYVTDSSVLDIAHNYAVLENHFGQNVMIHRKGATLARKGTMGIIPGSQGTKSYIVEGKGNPDSFHSCSHGAGRKMSRTAAKANLSLEAEQKKLDDKGILHSVRGKNNLDEAPGAYKDISVVMESQKDLVDIVTELTPLAVVKG